MKLRITYAALACALLLAGCAAGEGIAVSSSAEPAVSTAAEPAITPEATAEPTPEPTPAPTPNPASLLEYTTLPLDNTKKTPANYWTAYFENPSNPAAVDYACQLAMGLYNNDVDAVRAACSDRVLSGDFPLNDLDGLNISAFSLEGGRYDVPYLSLTVTDPGNTPFLRGRHIYYLNYDETGKIRWLSPSLSNDSPQSIGLASYRASFSEDVAFCGYASAELTNPLGLTWGSASLQCYDAYWVPNEDDDGHHYENRSVQDLGSVEAPPYSITSYAVPPDGNVLTDTKLEVVCEALNQFFAALADGSYTNEFYTTPSNDALLSAWDAAVPLPLAVTPEALRSCASQDNWGAPCAEIWVPLPQNCWAVIKTNAHCTGSEGIIDDSFSFNYYQTVPAALAAALPQ